MAKLAKFNPMVLSLSLFDDLDWLFGRNDGVEVRGSNVYIELPGFSKDDVNVEYDGKYLTVEAKNEGKKYLRERRYEVYVGKLDGKNIEATLENGLLVIKFPKSKKTKIKVL